MVVVQKQVQIFKRDVLRFPRLDTVLMIEKAILKSRGDLTMRQIWQRLPKKVMWQTFLAALDYLEYSGKIFVEKDKTVTWIWDPEGVRKLLEKKHLIVR